MIKIFSLGVCAVSMVAFYDSPSPDADASREVRTRLQDRAFLAEVEAREASNIQQVERADRDFLNRLQRDEPDTNPVPVAKAIAIRPQVEETKASVAEDGLPVRRAIAIERPVSPTAVISTARAALAVPATSTSLGDFGARTMESGATPAVPAGSEKPGAKSRASILIYRGEVFVRPAMPVQ